MLKNRHSLAELSRYLGAELKGDPDCIISSIASLDKALAGQISFIHDSDFGANKYRKFLHDTQASAVILSANYSEFCSTNQLITENPYLCYAKIAGLFLPKNNIKAGIHPTAVIGKNCQIAPSVSVGPHCVIGDNVYIGEQTVVGSGCAIGNDCSLGASCTLYSRVTLYHGIRTGDRVIIHSGAVIGADGFGMVNENGVWYKIPQLGAVVIGNDVEIGANTTIDRGALEDTVLGNGVKLDNQIQVAHNVRIGDHTAIAGCTAIAGGTQIGKYCMIGGGAAINGHIEITDRVILTALANVSASITQPGVYSSGVPLQPNSQWRKNAARFRQLDDLARRLHKLEGYVEILHTK